MASLQTIASEPSSMLQDFDIGEMVQSVGDLLGGLTAQAGRRGDRHALRGFDHCSGSGKSRGRDIERGEVGSRFDSGEERILGDRYQ